MYYVRHKVFNPNVETQSHAETLEKAKLVALMKRQVNYKYFMTDIWAHYDRI
jgi:hypothetical protein